MAGALESINYWMSLALVPLLVIILALLAAYLGRVKVVLPSDMEERRTMARVIGEWTYRRRLMEAGLDFFLIAVAFYLAFLANYGLVMNTERLALYLQTLPIALVGAYLSIFVTGVYRGIWRYVSLEDIIRFIQAALGSIALFAGIIFLINSFEFAAWADDFPSMIILFLGVFLFMGLSASRSSFKFLDYLFSFSQKSAGKERVLIFGGGDSGEVALRWIQMNQDLDYLPVGIFVKDPLMIGRSIHGVEVIGGLRQLPKFLQTSSVDGIIVALDVDQTINMDDMLEICSSNNCWVKTLRLEFELLS